MSITFLSSSAIQPFFNTLHVEYRFTMFFPDAFKITAWLGEMNVEHMKLLTGSILLLALVMPLIKSCLDSDYSYSSLNWEEFGLSVSEDCLVEYSKYEVWFSTSYSHNTKE